MSDQKRRIEIELVGKADTATAAALAVEKAFEKVIAKQKAAGQETATMEAHLAALKQGNAQAWTAEYAKGLEDVITQEKAAGRETAALEQTLTGLRASMAGGTAAPGTMVALGAATAKTNVELRDLSKFGAAGTQIISSLERASQGGTQAIFGLAGAVRGVIGIVTAGTGAIGLAVAAAGLAIGAFLAFTRKETKETKLTLDEAKTAAENLGKAKLDAFKTELKEINREADATVTKLNDILALQARVRAAQLGSAAAQRDLDPSLTPEARDLAAAQDKFTARNAAIDARREPVLAAAEAAQTEAAAARRQDLDATDSAQRAKAAAEKARRDNAELPRLQALRLQEQAESVATGTIVERLTPEERRRLRDLSDPRAVAERERALTREKPFADTAKDRAAAAEDAARKAADAAARAAQEEIAVAAERQQAADELKRDQEKIRRAAATRQAKSAVDRAQKAHEEQRKADLDALKAQASDFGESAVRKARQLAADPRVQADPRFEKLVSALEKAGERLAKNPSEENLAALKEPTRELFAEAKEAGIVLADQLQGAADAISALLNQFGAVGAPEPRARGGRAPAKKRLLVGEEGPEIVEFDQPSTVIPAPETARALATPQATATPKATATPQAAPTPTATDPSASADPSDGIIRSNAQALAQNTAQPPIIRSNAEALRRSSELSDDFRARADNPNTAQREAAQARIELRGIVQSLPRSASAADIGSAVGGQIRTVLQSHTAALQGELSQIRSLLQDQADRRPRTSRV
jgi:uncharacterized protein YaaR (DUF327 family)